jgi:hypothetical protein
VEVGGARPEKIETLDETSAIYRAVYMMRRSTATISEFTQSMERLEQLDAFVDLKRLFSERHQNAWKDRKAFLLEHKKALQQVRHNCGGHLLTKAVMKAMERMDEDATGFVRVNYTRDDKASLNFGFTYEVIALCLLLGRADDKDLQTYTETLFKIIRASWVRIVDVMHALANELIIPRFGL